MNNKKNRKGFTIVELVIVIAVIAILATVLVPTFSNVIKNANEAKILQEAKNMYTNYMVENAESETLSDTIYVKIGDSYYCVEDGVVEMENDAPKAYAEVPANGVEYPVSANNGNGGDSEEEGGEG